MTSGDLIKLLKAKGWALVRTKGSHCQFAHPSNPGKVVTVPHPKKDLGPGIVHVIMKETGLK